MKYIAETYAREKKNHFESEKTLTKMDLEITQNEIDSLDEYSHIHAKHICSLPFRTVS